MSPELLDTSKTYKKWQSTENSCILVLRGSTAKEGRSTSYGYTNSWLSPAAVHVAQEATKAGQKIAYYSCHPNIRAGGPPCRGKNLLSSIIYQILKDNPTILRSKNQSFRSMVSSEDWQDSKNDQAAVKVMFGLLREILSAMKDLSDQKSTMVIVLDRIELCDWKLRFLMNALVELVQQHCSTTTPPHPLTSKDEFCSVGAITIKILVILDPTSEDHWDADECLKMEKDKMDDGNRTSDATILFQEWNQRALSSLEMQMQIQKRWHSY